VQTAVLRGRTANCEPNHRADQQRSDSAGRDRRGRARKAGRTRRLVRAAILDSARVLTSCCEAGALSTDAMVERRIDDATGRATEVRPERNICIGTSTAQMVSRCARGERDLPGEPVPRLALINRPRHMDDSTPPHDPRLTFKCTQI
jgi:hypothetical protein